MCDEFIESNEISETLTSFSGFNLVGTVGQASDVASAFGFLLSDEAAWETGAVSCADGGVMYRRNWTTTGRGEEVVSRLLVI